MDPEPVTPDDQVASMPTVNVDDVEDPGLPVAPWVGWLFLGLAALLIPWLFVLWQNLPNRDIVRHYRTAWIGFDIVLALALARTGWLAWRGRDHVQLPAVAAATLLVVDAWFDILTASRSEMTGAVLSAALIELPLAALCFAIARNAERVRQHRLRWALRVDPRSVDAPVAGDREVGGGDG
jgi:hypothetical protein